MKYLAVFVFLFITFNTFAQNPVPLADPTIFKHKETYYLYGTGGANGFRVYSSTDMKIWKGPVGAKDGYALVKNDAFGRNGFWAPQILSYQKKFYMFYTADEHIAIANSESPLGPFKQNNLKSLPSDVKQIDPFILIDGDKKYLYHVRLNQGNRIYVAEMNEDFSAIKTETLKACISATEPWENTANSSWPVAEGPTVIKHKDYYYVFIRRTIFETSITRSVTLLLQVRMDHG